MHTPPMGGRRGWGRQSNKVKLIMFCLWCANTSHVLSSPTIAGWADPCWGRNACQGFSIIYLNNIIGTTCWQWSMCALCCYNNITDICIYKRVMNTFVTHMLTIIKKYEFQTKTRKWNIYIYKYIMWVSERERGMSARACVKCVCADVCMRSRVLLTDTRPYKTF